MAGRPRLRGAAGVVRGIGFAIGNRYVECDAAVGINAIIPRVARHKIRARLALNQIIAVSSSSKIIAIAQLYPVIPARVCTDIVVAT